MALATHSWPHTVTQSASSITTETERIATYIATASRGPAVGRHRRYSSTDYGQVSQPTSPTDLLSYCQLKVRFQLKRTEQTSINLRLSVAPFVRHAYSSSSSSKMYAMAASPQLYQQSACRAHRYKLHVYTYDCQVKTSTNTCTNCMPGMSR